MATPAQSNIELINALMGIPSKLFGSSTSQTISGGSQTTQNNISQAGVDALLKSLMEGTSGRPGLAAVAQGQRGAGLYNTNVRSMMVNDLMARSAAEVEKARAGTTVIKEPSTQKNITPGMLSGKNSMLGALLAGGAAFAGSKKGKELISELFSGGLKDAPISADIAQAGMGASSIAGDWGDVMDPLGTMQANAADFGAFGTSLTDFNLPSAAIDFSAGTDLLYGSMGDFGSAAVDFSAGTDLLYGGMDAAGAGLDVGMPGVGSMFNLLSGNNAGGGAGESAALSMIPGVGPVLAIANSLDVPVISDATDAIGDVVSDIGDAIGCFITTAVCEYSGLPDDCYELTVLREFRDTWLKENHPEDIEQYYHEAPVIVSRISAREDAATVYAQFNRDYIAPAVEALENGQYELAYTIYRNLFMTAKDIANGS